MPGGAGNREKTGRGHRLREWKPLDRNKAASPEPMEEPSVNGTQGPGPTGPEQLSCNPISEFAQWALAETGATTLGEAIALAAGRNGASPGWDQFAGIPLEQLAETPQHPYRIIQEWMDPLEPRQKTIFLARIASPRRTRTLREIARQIGVTRERTRQLEQEIREQLTQLIRGRRGLPILMTIRRVREELGTASPEARVEHLLQPPPETTDFREVLLEKAGPYRRLEDGWLLNMEMEGQDPAQRILGMTDQMGRIDMQRARQALRQWGVREELQEAWLLRHPRIRMFHGRAVVWKQSISDRMVLAMTTIGRPTTPEELLKALGERHTRGTAVNALKRSPHITRVSINRWGLAAWELPEYRGVARSIQAILEREGGSCPIDILKDRMKRTFDIAPNTTSAYCSAPIFVRTEKEVRLRTPEDSSVRCRPETIRTSSGIFDLGNGRAARILEVTSENLRGSGGHLTETGGSILGIQLNQEMVFTDRHGDNLRVTFPETSILGPGIGSVRNALRRLGAERGDHLTVVLDRNNLEFQASLTRQSEMRRDWQTVGRLTGLGQEASIKTLAQALRCSPGKVRHRLQQRSDFLLKLVPGLG